jgi:hypothetical protein
VCELLREILNGTVHHRRGLGIVANQDGIEHFLADVFGGLLSEGIFARFAQRLPPSVEDVSKGAFAARSPRTSARC